MVASEGTGEFTIVDNHILIRNIVSDAMLQHSRESTGEELQILEAGCGRKWGVDLPGVSYTLTGVDISETDLEMRLNERKDLDSAIVGDLKTVTLEDSSYDIIYNSFVLEHVDGAEQVLDNFVRWVKPGGIIILKLPDRDTSFGFLTRMTPFWVHRFYKRYIVGRNRKQVHPCFPVFYDKVVSRKGIRAYCGKKHLEIREEYGITGYFKSASLTAYTANAVTWLVHMASLGSLADKHSGLIYVLRKA